MPDATPSPLLTGVLGEPPAPADASAQARRLDQAAQARRLAIDASCRWPCLLLLGGATVWLLVGTALALVASLKLHLPALLSGPHDGWLTFGRVRPAHLNTVIYGWSAQAGLAVLLWLMCRLGGTPLRRSWLPLLAVGLWNIGVASGTVAILAGRGNGLEWLEFPTLSAFALFVAFAVLSIWAVLAFADRRERHVYVSQWYLFAAVFWFPWLYSTVQILLVLEPVRGVAQATINWWYAHNVLGLLFTPIGLATAYYLIPKIIGRPVHSYHLSLLGFWSLALFYSWAGAHHLIGGPLPAWVTTASIVASVMMLVPVVTVAINHHLTMRGHFALLATSPALRFTVFGAMCYTAVSVQGSLMALRIYNEPTHFTHHTIGHAHLGMYGFFSMVMFGAAYYMVPRLTGQPWVSGWLVSLHFWCSSLGVLGMFAVLSVGGAIQGLELNQATESLHTLVRERGLLPGLRDFVAGLQTRSGAVPFLTIVADTQIWLVARSVFGGLMALGHVIFAGLMAAHLLGLLGLRGGPRLPAQQPLSLPASQPPSALPSAPPLALPPATPLAPTGETRP